MAEMKHCSCECGRSDLHTKTKGVIAESLALTKMLDLGLEVFSSVVDINGIDFIVRATGGGFLEVQVKGVHTDSSAEWFQLQTCRNVEELRCRPYCVIGMTAHREFWIFPPEVFFDLAYSTCSTNKEGLTTVDLDLAKTRRGARAVTRDRIPHLRENWQLLRERSLAMTSV